MKNNFDVAILGSGFAGSILATILGRHGVSVLVIDAKSHPRFAIGESTIPQTSQLISLLAREYDVAELEDIGLGSPPGIRKNVGSTCGIKRTFGFAYHQLDEEHNPDEGIQFGNVWRIENHLFRQDVDTYLYKLSLSYGATVLQNTRVAAIDFSDDNVDITTDDGRRFSAQYVVDGTGYRSLLAEKYGLRETPCRFKHHSRSMFTHMTDVKPFESCVTNKLSVPWSEGTLHQVFERGWIWIIPFNNHPDSTNPLVSIGLTIDERVYPEQNCSPEEEFDYFLKRLPSVARQFTNSKTVRPWVRTNRLQYSSSRTFGPRFCLMSHAAGFIDPLFSRGLINSIEVIGGLLKPLLQSLKDGDFSEERFAPVEDLQRSILDYADRVVNGSFISWASFDVWNAWLRVWAIASGVLESNLGGHLLTRKLTQWKPVENPVFSPFEDPKFRNFFEQVGAIIEEFDQGKNEARETASALFSVIQAYDFQMNLPDNFHGQEWAVKNPDCRDLYLGSEKLHKRWMQSMTDPIS